MALPHGVARPRAAAVNSPASAATSIAVGSSHEDGVDVDASLPTPSDCSSILRELAVGAAAASRAHGEDDDEEGGDYSSDGGNDNAAGGQQQRQYPISMSSSVREHVFDGGLRYHAFRDGRYAFPNDEVEQNRDDMKHAMTRMLMLGRHIYAPVEAALEKGGALLDLGTGTGIWAMELADKYPNTVVHGVDLSPIQPNLVPNNVFFVVDDFEDEWMHPENSFDYIHVRHTLHSVHDRKALLQRIYRHLKPGGYVEFQELQFSPHCDDDTMTDSTPYAFRDFLRYIDDGLRALGSELNAVTDLPDEVRAAGFDDVTRRTHKCPIGSWPRDRRLRYCGLFMRTAIMDGLRGLVRRPLGPAGLGWTELQIEVFLVDVRKAVMDSDFHTYFPFHVVYARKPLR